MDQALDVTYKHDGYTREMHRTMDCYAAARADSTHQRGRTSKEQTCRREDQKDEVSVILRIIWKKEREEMDMKRENKTELKMNKIFYFIVYNWRLLARAILNHLLYSRKLDGI